MNRAGVYGDLFFETIAVRDGRICHLERHLKRIQRASTLLKFETVFSYENIESMVMDALQGQLNGRIRIVFYRNSNGFYLPNSNEALADVSYFALPEEKTSIDVMGLYSDLLVSCNALSSIKNSHALISVLAAKYAQENGWNDALLMNEYQRISEATASNIFIVKNETIYTPPISEGCVAGVMREYLFDQFKKIGVTVKELPLDKATLLDSDEVFLTNTIHPIVSVLHFESRKFGNVFTDMIRNRLNDQAL